MKSILTLIFASAILAAMGTDLFAQYTKPDPKQEVTIYRMDNATVVIDGQGTDAIWSHEQVATIIPGYSNAEATKPVDGVNFGATVKLFYTSEGLYVFSQVIDDIINPWDADLGNSAYQFDNVEIFILAGEVFSETAQQWGAYNAQIRFNLFENDMITGNNIQGKGQVNPGTVSELSENTTYAFAETATGFNLETFISFQGIFGKTAAEVEAEIGYIGLEWGYGDSDAAPGTRDAIYAWNLCCSLGDMAWTDANYFGKAILAGAGNSIKTNSMVENIVTNTVVSNGILRLNKVYNGRVDVITMTGQLVKSENLNAAHVDLSRVNAGFYLLTFGNQVAKIVVQ